MRNAHGCHPPIAVGANPYWGYHHAMKTPPGRFPTGEGTEGARRSPPPFPARRYPSLSDDGQPWFPRRRPTRPSDAESESGEERPALLSSVRVISVIAIVIIVALLAVFSK